MAGKYVWLTDEHTAVSKMETYEQFILKDMFSLLNINYCWFMRQLFLIQLIDGIIDRLHDY